MRRSGVIATLALMAATALILVSCGGQNPGESATSTTFAPLTVPGSVDTSTDRGTGSPATSTSQPVSAAASAQQFLDSVVVAAGPDCTAGSGSITITHAPYPGTGVDLLTAIVDGHNQVADGRQVSERLADGADRLVVNGVACDGAIRTVILVVDGETTRAIAVRMP